MVRIYYVKISEVFYCSDIFVKLISFVSAERQKKIKQFHFDIDKKLSLISEILIRVTMCKVFGISNNDIEFENNRHGKPRLKEYPDFHFNLSHTRNAIVIAISSKVIGIDIEKIRTVDLNLAKRLFTESEVTYIMKPDSNIDKRFFEIWTKKEAYIKCIGEGLSIPLNSFNVLNTNISKQINTFEIDEYMISICSEELCSDICIYKLSESDVENEAIELLQ